MRKISILSLMLFFSVSFSQTYQFDFLTKYSSTDAKTKKIRESVAYNNSDDFSYYLGLKKTEQDFSANLYDHERNLAHHFSVEESKLNGKIQFKFIYLNTSRLLPSNHFKNYRYEFSEISEDSPKIVLLKIFPSKRAKKPVSEKQFTLEKANKNLIPLYRSEWLHQYLKEGELQKHGNYIVSKAVERYKTDTCEVVLKDYKNVDLKITVPEK